MGKSNNRFDLDVLEGERGEQLTRELRTGVLSGEVEVKHDSKVSETGNVAIEYECQGKPSGIKVTTARAWTFVLAGPAYVEEILVTLPIARVRQLYYRYRHVPYRDVRGGDNDASGMVLVPVADLVARYHLDQQEAIW